MNSTRCARLHWREMVWYGWTVSSALVVAGAEVSLEIGPEGLEDLTDGELEELVRRFRGEGDGPRGKW